jgi:hypothetical protein
VPHVEPECGGVEALAVGLATPVHAVEVGHEAERGVRVGRPGGAQERLYGGWPRGWVTALVSEICGRRFGVRREEIRGGWDCGRTVCGREESRGGGDCGRER